MKQVNFGNFQLEVYDSIHNLPPHRESMMNFYALSEMGIGHDFNSIESHLSSLVIAVNEAIEKQEIFVVQQEVENLKLNYVTMASKYHPEHISWLCLVKSINGEPLVDLGEENLIQVADKLSQEVETEYAWRQIFDEIKKKFPTSWLSSFQMSQELQEDFQL